MTDHSPQEISAQSITAQNHSSSECTFIFMHNHLLIHCTPSNLARKISLHLCNMLNLRKKLESPSSPKIVSPAETISVELSHPLQQAMSQIVNITHTEHDILLSHSPHRDVDWNIIKHYISTNLTHILARESQSDSAIFSQDNYLMQDNLNTPELCIPVNYNGLDLSEVASILGLSEHEFIYWHSSQQWSVSFMGFTPGFAYLRCENGYSIPRRAIPRATVPAGSVAFGGEYCGIYPRNSPGGWQIIGTTPIEIWNPRAQSPNLITPMSTIRFSPIAC